MAHKPDRKRIYSTVVPSIFWLTSARRQVNQRVCDYVPTTLKGPAFLPIRRAELLATRDLDALDHFFDDATQR